MQFIVKATIPVKAGNDLVRNPQMKARLDQVMADIKPEAAYFAVERGQRTIYLFVRVPQVQEIPRVAEPLWLAFEAEVEFIPVMTREDLDAAGPFLEPIVQHYPG